jgi:chemotaxis protein CheC
MSAEPVNDASATPRAIAFTADERDAAAELFNIGMGRAAASLSRMVGDEVELSIPHVEILTVETLLERLAQQGVDDVSLVVQRFEGMFTGEALLVFPYEQSLELVRVLLSEATALEHITELERDVLAEVGNVLINACLGSLANVLGDEFAASTPAFESGAARNVLRRGRGIQEHVLFAEVRFSVRSRDLHGLVVFTLPLDSLEHFRASIARLLAR